MASTSPLQADRTDEFFSKVVDDKYGANLSHLEPEDMRAQSNFSLGEVENSGSASEVNGQKDRQSWSFSVASKNDASTGEQSKVLTEGAETVGTKGASFKEIQWSAFSVNSEQFGLGDSESDLFLGGEYGSLVNSETFSESKSTLLENTAGSISSHVGSNEHQCAQAYGSISEQSANLIEMKNQENLYPGLKYDTSTGQCYQPNDYNATTHTQSDILSIANANTHENSETKVQKASEGSEFDISDDVNLLHQTSPPVLETISDDSSILKSRNPVSQENREYPPNMLFDPQYPQWYYDTITQMWCTLESYDHSLHDASNLTQDPLTIDENALVNVQNAFEGSASEILDAVNLQQTSHPVLETIYEGSCVLNSRNQYPSNMVFDPQYPEWYYDTSTQKWYTLESYNHALHDASNVTKGQLAGNANALDKIQNAFEGSVPEISDHVNLQQTSQPVLETISEESTVFNSRSLVPQDSIYYPPNMVFDPQYPEWYYDTITQMWCTLESYNHLHDASSAIQGLQSNNVNALAGLSMDDHHLLHDSHVQSGQYTKREQSSQKSGWIVPEGGFKKHSNWKEKSGPEGHWNASDGGYGLPSLWQEQTIKESYSKASGNYDLQKTWQPELLAKNGDATTVLSNQLTGSFHGSQLYTGSHPANQLEPINLEPIVKHDYGRNNMISARRYVSSESIHHTNQPNMEQGFPAHLSTSDNGTESSRNYAQQSFQCANPSYSQFSYTPNEVRSTAGRPPHALVTFGFGGKVIVMKDSSFSSSSFVSGSQGTVGGVVLIHNLMDVVMTKADFLNTSTVGRFGYFHTLCQESFPGPLVGGNAASKDVNKWIDDRITSIESSSMDFQNGLLLKLLLSLLKILCQYYGRLRSPYGIETLHEGSDGPELAVSKLFASAKRNNTPFGGGSSMRCMKNPPSEGNIRATATEVQNLLVSGRRKEALQHAQEGQLWGTAVVLAAQLGEQFYVDTVKQMALRQFVCGSPLRTLYLLIAGQPADVFSADCSSSDSSGTVERPDQSSEGQQNGLLDDWQENLAIIASNRTKDDELVIIHLGDCLWKERGEVTAAHACYLLAEVNIEPYSDSARLCLIGADHWKNSRTYACPDFIQRTEIYEYSKVIGNSQFVLLPFQPYKLVYAYMLAEVGKVSDSLRYCQASMKMLKNSGRSPEVELWRALFSSLEERLRTHQQSGYGTNLASTKLVGKLFNSIDRSIHRMIGIPPLPPTLRNSGDGRDNNSQVQKVSSSQSAMAITSLIPSSSVEAISERTGDSSRKVGHNRSISEPDFGRNTKMNSTKDGSSYGQGNASISGGPSRFGRFGFQLLQKTIGWVSWPRHDRQAKLGESNKFYYDDKLKRWVEEGAELPAAEASLPPPPIAASFQNGKSDYDIKNAFKSDSLVMDAKQETKFDGPSEQGFGLPPVPPSQNQFSARNRGMVRSRYVDTFNKGGGSFTSTFQTPSAPSVKPLSVANFFVPSAPNQTNDASIRACIDESTITEEPSTSAVLPSLTPFSSSMQRFPSMDNITTSQSLPSGSSSFSRRAASWSGAYPAISNTKAVGMEQHSSVVSGVAPTFPPQNGTLHTESSSSSSQQLDADCSVLEDLHEVEL